MTTALEGGQWSAARPGRTLPPGKTRYPLYRRLGGPQGLSGQVRKISPPPSGFDPWTVHPVARRYSGYATRPIMFYQDRTERCLQTYGHFFLARFGGGRISLYSAEYIRIIDKRRPCNCAYCVDVCWSVPWPTEIYGLYDHTNRLIRILVKSLWPPRSPDLTLFDF